MRPYTAGRLAYHQHADCIFLRARAWARVCYVCRGLSACVAASCVMHHAMVAVQLGCVVGVVFQRGGQSEETKARLRKMLDLWTERAVYRCVCACWTGWGGGARQVAGRASARTHMSCLGFPQAAPFGLAGACACGNG